MKKNLCSTLLIILVGLLIANMIYLHEVQRGQQPHHYTDQELEEFVNGM